MNTPNTLSSSGLETVSGPFLTKTGKKLFVGASRRPDLLADDFFRDLGSVYRDVFAHGAPVDPVSWSEYARCECGQHASVEEVTGLTEYRPLHEIEASGIPQLPPCGCGQLTELFYDAKEIVREFKSYFRKDIYAAFMYNSTGELLGFSYAWIDELQNVWREKLAEFYAHSSLTYEYFLEQMHTNTANKLQANSQVMYYAETGMSLPARNMQSYLAMISGTLQSARQANPKADKLSVLATSTTGSNSYKVFAGAGCSPICSVKDSDLVVLHDELAPFEQKFSVTPSEFSRNSLACTRQILRAQRQQS